jgi:hypothetical protein
MVKDQKIEVRSQRLEIEDSHKSGLAFILLPALLFLFLLGVGTSFSQEIAAKASTDKSEYLVGDYINYTISISCVKGMKIYPPAFDADSLKNIFVIEKGKPEEEENDNVNVTFKYILSGYDSTGVTIPPVAVPYQAPGDSTTRFAFTNSVSFVIQTLKVNPQGEIKDIKPPMKILLNWKLIVFWTLFVLFLTGIMSYSYLLHRKRRVGKQSSENAVKLPPHVVALNALDELQDQKLWQKGMIKEYHSTITEIIRRYFEGRFNMPAMEVPTSEAIQLLGRNRECEPILGTTYDFLSNADLVKFAKFIPLDSVNEEMMKQAYEIVNKTIPAVEDKTNISSKSSQDSDYLQAQISREEHRGVQS